MEIVIRHNGCFFDLPCCVCLNYFPLGDAVAMLVDDPVDDPNERPLDVCPECLAAGLSGMIERVKATAARIGADEVNAKVSDLMRLTHVPSKRELEVTAEQFLYVRYNRGESFAEFKAATRKSESDDSGCPF